MVRTRASAATPVPLGPNRRGVPARVRPGKVPHVHFVTAEEPQGQISDLEGMSAQKQGSEVPPRKAAARKVTAVIEAEVGGVNYVAFVRPEPLIKAVEGSKVEVEGSSGEGSRNDQVVQGGEVAGGSGRQGGGMETGDGEELEGLEGLEADEGANKNDESMKSKLAVKEKELDGMKKELEKEKRKNQMYAFVFVGKEKLNKKLQQETKLRKAIQGKRQMLAMKLNKIIKTEVVEPAEEETVEDTARQVQLKEEVVETVPTFRRKVKVPVGLVVKEVGAVQTRRKGIRKYVKNVKINQKPKNVKNVNIMKKVNKKMKMIMKHPKNVENAKKKAKGKSASSCGSCASCQAADCSTCRNCRDKVGNGGPGRIRKRCLGRICSK